jgi:hypothetical protein
MDTTLSTTAATGAFQSSATGARIATTAMVVASAAKNTAARARALCFLVRGGSCNIARAVSPGVGEGASPELTIQKTAEVASCARLGYGVRAKGEEVWRIYRLDPSGLRPVD